MQERLLRRGRVSVKLRAKGAICLALLTGGVFIAGLGGLGGWLLEHMLRLGPEFIRAADGDVFDESNLDRQLLSSPLRIGQSKAAAAQERAALVAPQVRFEAVAEFMTEDNCARLLSGCRLALDGLDNVAARLTLERGCAELGIPLVHGAVGGWFFEAGTVPPGSGMLGRVYPGGREPEHTRTHSSVVSACAAVQAAEAEKLLTGAEPALWGRLLMADLDSMETHVVSFCTFCG